MRRSRALLHQVETLKLELLHTPINRLGLGLKGSYYEQAIPVVREDLARVGLTKLNPQFYISTGYGCIAGSAIISLGFYDLTPVLRDLNEEFRGFRYSEADMVNLLRHEIGHAFCYTYKLYRRPDFRELFRVEGNFFNTYPESDDYDYNPWSREYVNPAGDHYAQKHPDEDFAETFCVWLDPRSGWRRKYSRKPKAVRKIHYIAGLVQELGGQPPVVESDAGWMYERVEDLKMTVGEFFKADDRRYRGTATGFVDPDLQALFRAHPRVANRRALYRDYAHAEAFIRRNKQALVSRIAYWVGVDTVVVQDLLDKCVHRVRVLDLWLEGAAAEKKLIELTSYITALCTNYKNTGYYLRLE